jgi:hypothetical protein
LPASLILPSTFCSVQSGGERRGEGGGVREKGLYVLYDVVKIPDERIRGDNSTALKEQTQTQTRRQTVRKKLREIDRRSERQTKCKTDRSSQIL